MSLVDALEAISMVASVPIVGYGLYTLGKQFTNYADKNEKYFVDEELINKTFDE